MDKKTSFFEKYQPIFVVVCSYLGQGWKVNLLDDCKYRIKLTSPNFKGFNVFINFEKNRFKIDGCVSSRFYRGEYFTCTLSLNRKIEDIARAIETKILLHAKEEIIKARSALEKHQKAQEEDKIIKGMLSRLVTLSNHYNAFTGFNTVNNLSGNITRNYAGYGVEVKGLTIDQMIKLTCFINSL